MGHPVIGAYPLKTLVNILICFVFITILYVIIQYKRKESEIAKTISFQCTIYGGIYLISR